MKKAQYSLALFCVIGVFFGCTLFDVGPSTVVGLDIPVLVSGGTFLMGFDAGDQDEKPVHEVRVSDFFIMKTEVTQQAYAAIIGTNPSSFIRGLGDSYPVNCVSWYDVVSFANMLSMRDGFTPCYTISGTDVTCDWSANGWRLPTEAEWEFAARGGNLTQGYIYAGSNDVNAVAWTFSLMTHPVGTKAANELGLYDMSGNVWEWVWDAYGDYAAVSQADPRGPASGSRWADRGGGWSMGADGARTSHRGVESDRAHRDGDLGFRLVRSGTPEN